jgi:hypothetical protein
MKHAREKPVFTDGPALAVSLDIETADSRFTFVEAVSVG